MLFFTKTCIYDASKNETLIYGHSIKEITHISLDISHTWLSCPDRFDFLICIQGRLSTIEKISFGLEHTHLITLTHLSCEYPFEKADLGLTIISTMCKQYSHRLEEWIQYNLKLGFTGILIFNNDGNRLNMLNEGRGSNKSMDAICKKWPNQVCMVDFPYAPLPGNHWNTIQSSSLQIGVAALRSTATSIALIDADEFIYLPKNPMQSIQSFLKAHSKTITIKSNLLTNKGDSDIINNNVLDLATYIGIDKFTKTILHTPDLAPYEFIVNPHEHPNETILSKEDIIHYHCWMNKRCPYDSNMRNFTGLRDFFHTTDKSAK